MLDEWEEDAFEEVIEPQEGKQSVFLESSADIVIYGGAAGGGKTYGLLLEAVRYIDVEGFGVVFFRKQLTQITKEGGLWDTARAIYPQIGGRGIENRLVYKFEQYGTKIDFSYLQQENDVEAWQGTQIPLIIFDELTHFTKRQFFYMLSRNRSTCGVKPYVRATCNPDPDSWVRGFIDWWIDEKGNAIEERSGVVRWFVVQNDEIFWFSRKIDAHKKFPNKPPKSCTFISSNVYDNQILLESDPDYIANLEALPRVERERLLGGNWDVRAGAGDYYQPENFEIVDALPEAIKECRAWDFAATKPSDVNPDPDWTVGLRGMRGKDGYYYITDMKRFRENPAKVEANFKNTGTQDGKDVHIRIPKDAGSAGKVVADSYVKIMAGYKIKAERVTGDKEVRAVPASALAGIGQIRLLRAKWNKTLIDELHGFPLAGHDDIVDALSDLIEELTFEKKKAKRAKKPMKIR